VFIGIALVLAMVLVGAGATLWRGGARGGNRRVPVPVRTLAAPAKRPPEAMPRSSRGTRTDVGRPSQRRTTSDTRRVESPIEQPEHVTTPVAAEPASTEAHGAASAAATGSRPDSVQALMTTQSQTGVPDDALATTRGDIEIATQRAQGGDYVGANEAWRAAGEQVAVLSTTYPNAPEVAALRKQVVHGMLLTQGACQTARRIATVRGQEKPRCR
jgi:hypothetical protein